MLRYALREVSEGPYPAQLASLGRSLSYPKKCFIQTHGHKHTHRQTDRHLQYYYIDYCNYYFYY